MPYLVGIEEKFAAVQPSFEAEQADEICDGYDE